MTAWAAAVPNAANGGGRGEYRYGRQQRAGLGAARRRFNAGEPVARPHAGIPLHRPRATCRRRASPSTGSPAASPTRTQRGTVTVSRITPATPNAYYMPGADPGEGFMATNDQLFGSESAPSSPTDVPAIRASSTTSPTRSAGSRTRAAGPSCRAPWPATSWAASRPRRCRCCPRWPAGMPSATSGSPPLPPRRCRTARSPCAATSQGHMDDKTHTFTSPSIFGLLGQHGSRWAHLRLRRRAADQVHVHRHRERPAAARRQVHRLPGGGGGRHAARVHRSWSRAGGRPATASTRTTTWPSASSSSTTSTRRCGPGRAGRRPC